MKKWLTNNLALKVVSILVAMVLWFIVVNIDDPDKTKTFSKIEVEVLNQDAINDSGKVYNILDNSNFITVEVTAPRSYLKDLNASDIKATADLEQVDLDMGLVKINVSVTKSPENVTSIVSKTTNMKVSIEELLGKQFPIKTNVTGTPAEGYAIGDSTTSQSIVKIQGAASVVETIESVVAEVDVSDMDTDVDTPVTLRAYDNNGKLISMDKLTFSTQEVDVNVDILKVKEVPLVFSVEGEPADGYRVVGDVQSSTSTVKVAGSDKVLKKINSVSIASSELDIAGRSTNLEKTVDISKYIRDDCKLISNSEVAVTVVIEALQAKEIAVPKEKIKLLNVPEDLQAEVNNDSVSIAVWGVAEELEKLTVDDLTISADLSGKSSPGMYNDVRLDVKVPNGFVAGDSYSVSILMTSVTPEETKAPEESAAPDITDELQTTSPEETDAPLETESPQESEQPVYIPTPVPTEMPTISDNVDNTETNGGEEQQGQDENTSEPEEAN